MVSMIMTEQYYKNTAYGAILKPSSVIERERERERDEDG